MAKDDYYASEMDYNVLSVGAMTLGLILLVEHWRHMLDKVHHKFFAAVLDTFYRELATLGIVEFCLHLLGEFYPDYNKARKDVFGSVHFLLFYTAILNVLQSVHVYQTVTRRSRSLWIDTELLDVFHYVEIREEFESLGKLSVLSPTQRRQYEALQLQVRFHNLRLHCLQSYQLPLNLKISDYLMRSQHAVLLQLTHVHHNSWIYLTAGVCGLYYGLGMIYTHHPNQTVLGRILVAIFFGCIAMFVIVVAVLDRKMKKSFQRLMDTEAFWNTNNDADENDTQVQQRDQLDALFWGGEPKYITKSIQFTQFGYAVCCATLLVFYDEMFVTIQGWVYWLSLSCCYFWFVRVVTHVLPQYTLCTSLGQLVDERRLRETVALFRLEQAKLEQQYSSEETVPDEPTEIEEEDDDDDDDDVPDAKPAAVEEPAVVNETPVQTKMTAEERRQRRRRMKTVSDGVALMRANTLSSDHGSMRTVNTGDLMAELVNLDTESLRQTLPEAEQAALRHRQFVKRRNRRKTPSDGVSSMAFSKMSTAADMLLSQDDSELGWKRDISLEDEQQDQTTELPETTATTTVAARRAARRRWRSVSDGVAAMAMGRIPQDVDTIGPDDVTVRPSATIKKRTPSPKQQTVRFEEESDSIASDDGYCDDDDAPDTLTSLSIRNHPPEEPVNRVSLVQRLYKLFLNDRFEPISDLFGTILAFILVGERVEGFIRSEALISDKFVTLALPLPISFWSFTSWCSLHMFASALIIFVVYRVGDCKNCTRDLMAVYSAGLDIVIFAVCILTLFLAETQRCCLDDDMEDLPMSDAKYTPPSCDCPMFGTRRYGGLGSIEPYTVLVTLRVFRLWMARHIIAVRDGKYVDPEAPFGVAENNSSRHSIRFNDISASLRPKKVKVHPKDHGHHNHQHTEVIVAKLWEEVIGKNPEVVKEHGEFSEEILRLMLGVGLPAVPRERDAATTKSSETSSTKETQTKEDTLNEAVTIVPSTAQVLALSEGPTDGAQTKKLRIPRHASMTIIPPVALFASENTNLLTNPNSRLVRSMRRCDRKFLPILDKWAAVDVVVTRFEMVYLDVRDEDTATRSALVATKGGKGLRLADVVHGRKIVGRLLLSDILRVHVVRQSPSADVAPTQEGEEHLDVEFWKHASTKLAPGSRQWDTITSDTLRIETKHGQFLHLRFYSDYDENKLHHSVTDELSFKYNAFQWAQTCGRFCYEQLDQSLPHCGTDTAEELEDYLAPPPPPPRALRRASMHRTGRISSAGELARPKSPMRQLRKMASASFSGPEVGDDVV